MIIRLLAASYTATGLMRGGGEPEAPSSIVFAHAGTLLIERLGP